MSGYKILIGTDGSPNAQEAVEFAADLAQRLGAKATLVHTFEPLAHLDRLKPETDLNSLEAAARESLDHEWAAPFRDRGVEYQTRLAHGVPAEVVLDLADEIEADLVVVGARGLGRLQMLTMGSTSSKVVHAGRRPVVVVPGSTTGRRGPAR